MPPPESSLQLLDSGHCSHDLRGRKQEEGWSERGREGEEGWSEGGKGEGECVMSFVCG